VIPVPEVDACALGAKAGDPVGLVGLTDPVDSANAPHPSNDSERLLFRQLYETLLRVDCEGRLRPGLASSWERGADAHTWTVRLREGARFADGTPVTGENLVVSWSAVGGGLRAAVLNHVASVAPVDARSLTITMREPVPDAPRVLAHPDLAIGLRVDGAEWPVGTSGWRVASATRQEIALVRADAGAVTVGAPVSTSVEAAADRSAKSTLRFIVAPGSDPRDLLDRGVDLLVTADRPALDYAASLQRFESFPLAWNRMHVFVSPWRDGSSDSLSLEARQTLARDAVRGEARGAQEPFWWQASLTCELPTPRVPREPSLAPSGRVVYRRGDAVSRDLAERLVGLRGASPAAGATDVLGVLLPPSLRSRFRNAVAVDERALVDPGLTSLFSDTGSVIAVESRPLAPCRASGPLAAWSGSDVRGKVVALVESRSRAIVKRGSGGLTHDWDGGVTVAGAGR
jgi:hypothetical protein